MQIGHQWHNQSFILHDMRVMYWEQTKILIASDLHLGKSGHFRKSGIAIPQDIMKQDLMRLFHCIQHFQPEQLIVVGDLFHSHNNKELDMFLRWRQDIAWLNITLVRGNHDILMQDWYNAAAIAVTDALTIHNISFVHDPADYNQANEIAMICGHMHPGISIKSIARQTLHFPCFYFSENICVLPAFSLFTGTHAIKPKKHDTVFAIAAQQLIRV